MFWLNSRPLAMEQFDSLPRASYCGLRQTFQTTLLKTFFYVLLRCLMMLMRKRGRREKKRDYSAFVNLSVS